MPKKLRPAGDDWPLKLRTLKVKPLSTFHKGPDQITQPDHPIHPIVNWGNAPTYKLAKSFSHKINQFAPLPHAFNVTNSTDLINQLLQTPVTPTTTFASLDITNMYSNVLISETRKIPEDITLNYMIDPDIRHELFSWFDIITKHNYFIHNNNIHIVIQEEGLAMGASSSSSILSEIFLQHVEHSHIPRLTQKRNTDWSTISKMLMTTSCWFTILHTQTYYPYSTTLTPYIPS
jgi:hypothetical protein